MRRGANGDHIIGDLPQDGIECRICRDSGLYQWDNEWRVCMSPLHADQREQLQREADGLNSAFAKLEARTKR